MRLLLSAADCARALGIGRSLFYGILPTLKARGLREVRIGRRVLFTAASLERVVYRAADREEVLA